MVLSSHSSTLVEVNLDPKLTLNSFDKEVNILSFTLHENSAPKTPDYIPKSPLNKNIPVFLAQSASRASDFWKQWDSSTLKFLFLCIAWYSSSSITNNIGKVILMESNYPLTLTYVQFGIVAFFCILIRCFSFKNRTVYGETHFSKKTRLDSIQSLLSRFRKTLSLRFLIPSRKDFYTCLPLALFQISTHICNSYATAAIPVSFVHTIKALSPLFTVLCYRFVWSIKYPIQIYLALFPLTTGVMMFCYDTVAINFIGIVCSLLSCIIYALQSILTKKHLFKTPSQHSTSPRSRVKKIDILLYSSLIAFVLMFPLWWMGEGQQFYVGNQKILSSVDSLSDLDDTYRIYRLIGYYFLNGGSQCAQALLSFTLLTNTDVVTFSVASQLKRVVVITTAMLYFSQPFTLLRAGGLILTIWGLYVYDQAK